MVKAGRYALVAMAVGFAYLTYVYLTLPDVRALRTANPATTAFIELRAREARAKGQPPRRVQQWVSYARVSQELKRAVLVAEDAAFWDHEGVDFEELQKSLETDWARGQLARGGSTITQQLAKNLYLSPSKNPIRKLREFLIARRLEAELPKSRILEIYLNVIEWGDGVYGAESAARTYFQTSASALGASQSAALAACIINPRVMNPARPTARQVRRQQLILRRMGGVVPPPDTPLPPPGNAPPPPAEDTVSPPQQPPPSPARVSPPDEEAAAPVEDPAPPPADIPAELK